MERRGIWVAFKRLESQERNPIETSEEPVESSKQPRQPNVGDEIGAVDGCKYRTNHQSGAVAAAAGRGRGDAATAFCLIKTCFNQRVRGESLVYEPNAMACYVCVAQRHV